MRRLAENAGIRLSNVQYYFKSRDDILVAMVARYFDECAENLLKLTQENQAQTQRERVRFLVETGLSHGREISDMCRAFREIWAISTRSVIIDRSLMEYYGRFADLIADFAIADALDIANKERLKALLIPYFEGYSVTARSLSIDSDKVAELLTDIALGTTLNPSDRQPNEG